MVDITFGTDRLHRDTPWWDRLPVQVMYGRRDIGTGVETIGHGRKAAGNVLPEGARPGWPRNGGTKVAVIACAAATGAKISASSAAIGESE